MSNKRKILVIDDESQIRKLLKLILEANDFEVLTAETGRNGLQLAASLKPDLIILDLNLPDEDGFEILKQLREWTTTHVLILSVRSSENDKIRLLDAGADDYITKPFHTGELLARVRVAFRHSEPSQENPSEIIGPFEINYSSRTIKKDGDQINLTPTEYAILKLLIINKNKVLTHRQILENIWGNPFMDETQYLRVFIGQLRKKIESYPSQPVFLKTVPGVGYIFGTQ